eukprot:gene34335-44353_t
MDVRIHWDTQDHSLIYRRPFESRLAFEELEQLEIDLRSLEVALLEHPDSDCARSSQRFQKEKRKVYDQLSYLWTNLAFGLISVAGFLLYPLCSALLSRIDKYDILAIGIALGQIFRV